MLTASIGSPRLRVPEAAHHVSLGVWGDDHGGASAGSRGPTIQLAAGLAAESSQHIDAEAAEPIPRKSCGVADSNLSQASEISFRLNVFDPMSASFCSSVSFFLVFFRAKRVRARARAARLPAGSSGTG